MNMKAIGRFLAAMALSLSSLSMAAIQQVTFIIEGGFAEGSTRTVSGYGSFTWNDTGVKDNYFLNITDLLSLSFTISGSEVAGINSSFSLSDCSFANIGPTPAFGGGLMGLDCDNGANKIVSQGNSFALITSDQAAPEEDQYVFVFSPLSVGTPDRDDVINLSLQEPQPGSVYSGVSNVRGWVLSIDEPGQNTVIERVELFIDGQFKGTIPYGGPRSDVGSKFPEIAGSFNSGFSMALGYNGLNSGEHTITVRAFANTGVFKEQTAKFNVVAFHEPFFADPTAIKLSNSQLVKDGSDIVIRDLSVDGELYDVRLRWSKRTQGFEMIQIQ